MNRFTAFPSMPVMRGNVVFSVLYYTYNTAGRENSWCLTNMMSPQWCSLQDEKTKSPLFSGARSYKMTDA